jgi:hypothetical protein
VKSELPQEKLKLGRSSLDAEEFVRVPVTVDPLLI